MTVKTAAATSRVNQPPWAIFVRLAAKNVSSTSPKTTATTAMRQRGHCHCTRATDSSSTVVMTNVPVTATP